MSNRLDDITVRTRQVGRTSPGSTSRYRRVLVPIAGDVDERVVQIGGEIADRIGAELEVVAVVSAGLEDLDAWQMRCELAAIGRRATIRVVTGDDVVAAVLAAASESDALLCLGTRGASALEGALFGSTGADLIERSTEEVLVVGPHCRRVLAGNQMVVAVDGSPASEAVVPTALDLADRLGLRASLVEVVGVGDRASRRAELAAVSSVVRRHGGHALDRERLLVQGRRVDEALVRVTEQADVAMMAMSTRGVNRFRRLVEGSVTLKVIRDARCPVLVGPRSDRPQPHGIDAVPSS